MRLVEIETRLSVDSLRDLLDIAEVRLNREEAKKNMLKIS